MVQAPCRRDGLASRQIRAGFCAGSAWARGTMSPRFARSARAAQTLEPARKDPFRPLPGSCRLLWLEALVPRTWPQTRRELANLADQTQVNIIVTKSGNLKVLPWPTALLGPYCCLATTLFKTMGCIRPALKVCSTHRMSASNYVRGINESRASDASRRALSPRNKGHRQCSKLSRTG